MCVCVAWPKIILTQNLLLSHAMNARPPRPSNPAEQINDAVQQMSEEYAARPTNGNDARRYVNCRLNQQHAKKKVEPPH